jgi:hypothetical protein
MGLMRALGKFIEPPTRFVKQIQKIENSHNFWGRAHERTHMRAMAAGGALNMRQINK